MKADREGGRAPEWGDKTALSIRAAAKSYCECLATGDLRPHISSMNRREFTRSLAALGLAPALPVLPAAAASTPAKVAFTPYMYGLGAHLARSSGRCSVAMLVQKLRLAPEVAQAMQAQLLRHGIITAPNAAGLAAAAQPYMQGASLVQTAVGAATDRVRSTTRELVESHLAEPVDDPDTPEDMNIR